MPKGKFTKEQNTHIESFMPDFVKELERGVDGTGLTRWKQSTASNILDSPLFLSLDMVAVPRNTWFEPFAVEVCRPAGQKIKSIPWAEIVSNPGQYYDTEGHSFPITLAHPRNLSTIGVITIAQVLLSTSVINSPTPFRFLEDKETVLVPPSPVTSTIPTILPPPVIQAPQAPPVSEAQPPLSSSPPSPTMTEGPERPQSQTSNNCSVESEVPDQGKKKRKRAKTGIEKNTESAPVPQARRQSARARNKPSVSSSAPKAKDTSARGKKKPKWPGYATVDSDGNDISDSD
ncbi:hypothetical protein B0H10DRAFT_1951003 [Mycena sp. CBHHK59/15]|nr:hypothetical protein B0H10DRAFT_1951003 [Mycena sp. CBHHK59/15]